MGLAQRQWPKQLKILRDCNEGGLIKRATERDESALGYLGEAGIRARLYVDPAFFAPYPENKKTIDLVVNYKAAGGNGHFTQKHDAAWRSLAAKVEGEVSLVTVHEPGKWLWPRTFSNAEVFDSSDHRRYKEIYSKTRLLIGGRMHGVTPVLACGGRVILDYEKRKVEAVTV